MSNLDVKSLRNQSLGWMLQRCAGGVGRKMEAALAEHDLTLAQFAVMMSAIEFDGQNQREIGTQLSMPAYAISRNLDQLEQRGLIERKPDPKSRRTTIIEVTKTGRALGPALFAIVNSVNGDLWAEIAEEDRDAVSRALMALIPTLP